MKPPLPDLDDLTVNEAILFAYRYHLIDDCRPEGAKVRLVLGNQSLTFTEEELRSFLHTLLRGYERTVLLSGDADEAPASPHVPVKRAAWFR